MKRTLKRLDLTAKSFIALVELVVLRGVSLRTGAGVRSHLHARRRDAPDDGGPVAAQLRATADEQWPDAARHALSLGEPQLVADLAEEREPFDPLSAMDAGLVTFAPDEIDWDDEVRLAIEARAAMSPDARRASRPTCALLGPRMFRMGTRTGPVGVARQTGFPAAQRGGRAWRAARVR